MTRRSDKEWPRAVRDGGLVPVVAAMADCAVEPAQECGRCSCALSSRTCASRAARAARSCPIWASAVSTRVSACTARASGGNPPCALPLGAGHLIIVGGDVPARLRVVPLQLPVFPAQVQLQDRTVALQHVLLQLLNVNRSIDPRPPAGPRPARTPWLRPVSSKRQYSGMPRAS